MLSKPYLGKILDLLFLLSVVILTITSSQHQKRGTQSEHSTFVNTTKQFDTATFGAGCFWCVEAIFQQLKGVVSVTSGYSGGHQKNPTYEDVCTGNTGHAEVSQIIFDPKKITYDELLEAFWTSHDPTTLNQQGADIGTQYRSVIFYHNQHQKELAENYKRKLNDEHAFDKQVITEISPFKEFYKAESYHQNYYKENSNKPYCMFVIRPKLEKFRKVFNAKLKTQE